MVKIITKYRMILFVVGQTVLTDQTQLTQQHDQHQSILGDYRQYAVSRILYGQQRNSYGDLR